MTQPIRAPANSSNATARRNAIPIATHETAVTPRLWGRKA
jgi:hypothetical protein